MSMGRMHTSTRSIFVTTIEVDGITRKRVKS